MFTGLIQHLGTLGTARAREGGIELRIESPQLAPLIERGESIAVDGVCLTVEVFDSGGFTLFASPETLAKTNLGDRRAGDLMNLERAMALGDRLGGHLVSGHVDATGRFRSAREVGEAREIWIEAPAEIIRQSIPKGSIAVDGISLTIVELTEDAFSIWIIPETWQRTTLSRRRPGDRVNLESDLIGKYVFRFLETGGNAKSRDETLREIWDQFNDREG